MAVERVDYYSDEEYEHAYTQEQKMEHDPVHVVPCFRCGEQMYEIAIRAWDNICGDCAERSKPPESEIKDGTNTRPN